MGYTHYWYPRETNHDAETFATLVALAKKVITLAQARGIKLAGPSGTGKPAIRDELVGLNGVGDESHESFVIQRDGNSDFEFCKTACKPYDVVVAAILVLYKHFFPVIRFTSDGDLGDLKDGIDLASEAMGVSFKVTKGRGDTGFSVSISKGGEKEAAPVVKSCISVEELELLKYAVSFLATHTAEASEELDIEINRTEVEQLEAKIYKTDREVLDIVI